MADMNLSDHTPTKIFRDKLEELDRDELLDIIKRQNKELYGQLERCEFVFERLLTHLYWDDGQPVEGREFTKEELIHLIDVPFIYSKELYKFGFTEEQQRQLHIASDPVLWAKHFLGIEPRVYQILVLRDPNARKVMRFGRRMGKRLDVKTPIMTTEGWSTMGDLRVGDKVFDEKGKECNVTYISPIQLAPKSYKLTFSDGSTLLADADHQWVVDTKLSRKALGRSKNPRHKPVQLTTQDMVDAGIKTKVYTDKNGVDKYEVNYSIRVCEPVDHKPKDLPIDPYILGLYLGDGTSASPQITTSDPEVLRAFEEQGYQPTHKTRYDYRVNGDFWDKYKELNLRKNKHIPDIYMIGSIEQRTELLKGLMDSDGCCLEQSICEFTQKNEKLALQTKSLIESLGYRCKFRKEPARLYGKDCGFRNRIIFTPWRPVFKLERKLKNQNLKDQPSGWQMHRYITNIEPIEPVEMRCISVDSPSRLYLAGDSYIPTHNTFALAIYALWYAYVNPSARILVVSPMKEQVGLIYEEVIAMAEKSHMVEDSIERAVKSPQYAIQFSNKSSIKFFTSGMKSNSKTDVARGQEADVIILDEMDYMGPDDLIALMAMLQTTDLKKTTKKSLIAASTPSGLRNTFWKWNTDKSLGFSAFWFPAYCSPGWDADTEKEMREMYPRVQAYRHEIEADWGEVEEGVYPRKNIDLAFTGNSWDYIIAPREPTSRYVFGVDWDKYTAGVNIAVLELCSFDHPNEKFAGKNRLVYREEVSKGDFTYLSAVRRIVELNEIFQPEHIYIDKGYGEVQLELFKDYGVKHPETKLHLKVKAFQFSENIEMRDPFTKQPSKKDVKSFMVDNLYKMLEENRVIFSEEDDELYFQLISYIVIRTSSTGKPLFGAGGQAVDHAHDALILACLAVTQNYDDLFNMQYARKSISVSNESFLELFAIDTQKDKEIAEDTWENEGSAPISRRRAMTVNLSNKRNRSNNAIRRKMF